VRPFVPCPDRWTPENTPEITTPMVQCEESTCHFSTPCVEIEGGSPKCRCPNSVLVSPYENCPHPPPGANHDHADGCDGFHAAEECKDEFATCRESPDDGKAMCLCPPGTDMDGFLVEPHRGTCRDLCSYRGSGSGFYPCGEGTDCTMVHGWAQCSCPNLGGVLHYENCH
jgi:hypothetical protein